MQREIFGIVEGAIGRLLAGSPVSRAMWKAIWRANVRARLTLTLRLCLKSGHADAACAAWHGILEDTGRSAPELVERTGARVLRWVCRGRIPETRDARRSVSPL
jgi:hypothetical protein